MGGVMPYGRLRTRNGLTWRPQLATTAGVDPYPGPGVACAEPMRMFLGDLNRFERDALGLGHLGDELPQHYAEASGESVETVKRVLAAVFADRDYPVMPIFGLGEL